MRHLIVGGSGMLGHRLWLETRRRGETYATVRGPASLYAPAGLFEPKYLLDRFDAGDARQLADAFRRSRPDVVFNAAAAIRPADPVRDLAINAVLPHRLALLCASAGARLIHVSTDGVFSGRTGHYGEKDLPDAEDGYGRSKALGEVDEAWALTIRTCPVGRELFSARSLVEWFLSQRGGIVKGFVNARFSALTSAIVARVLADIAERHPSLRGVWHLGGTPSSKFEFLEVLNEVYACGTQVVPDESVRVDRTLDSSRLEAEIGFSAPPMREMVHTLRDDPVDYVSIQRGHAEVPHQEPSG